MTGSRLERTVLSQGVAVSAASVDPGLAEPRPRQDCMVVEVGHAGFVRPERPLATPDPSL